MTVTLFKDGNVLTLSKSISASNVMFLHQPVQLGVNFAGTVFGLQFLLNENSANDVASTTIGSINRQIGRTSICGDGTTNPDETCDWGPFSLTSEAATWNTAAACSCTCYSRS